MQSCFYKVDRPSNRPGKGSLWVSNRSGRPSNLKAKYPILVAAAPVKAPQRLNQDASPSATTTISPANSPQSVVIQSPGRSRANSPSIVTPAEKDPQQRTERARKEEREELERVASMQKTLNQHVLHELIPPVSERMPPLIKNSGVRPNTYGPQVHAWSGDLWLESPHYPLMHPSELEEQQRKSTAHRHPNTPTTSSYHTFFTSTLYQKDAFTKPSDSERQEDRDSLLSPHLIARCLSPFPPVSTKSNPFYMSKSMHTHKNCTGLMSPILSPVSASSSSSSPSFAVSSPIVHNPRPRTTSHKSQKSMDDSSFFSSFFESSVKILSIFIASKLNNSCHNYTGYCSIMFHG